MTTTAETKIRVLIADDHAVAREGLAVILSRQKDMRVVGEASDGIEAVERCAELKPDVVLMDLRMPRMGGHDAIKQIAKFSPRPGIIVFTTYEGDEDVRRALQAGATGYLVKDSTRQVVWETIRKVYRGERAVSASLMNSVIDALSKPLLTEREQKVLELMADGLTNKEIGGTLFISEGTAKTHVNTILTKLAANSRTEAVITAARRGLVRMN